MLVRCACCDTPLCTLLAVVALLAALSGPALAAAPTIGLTQVGTPIWKPGDFQLFIAPAAPFPDAFLDTLDMLLPLEGPGVATYTPHAGPYDTELSTDAAAAGFVNQQVFPESAITLNPNGVYFMMMWLPDPGIVGSSCDFASGPVIPNSLFPFSLLAEMWLDGVKVETLQDQMVDIRPDAPGKPGDVGFDGAMYCVLSQVVWWPWADDANAGPTGSHELRWSLRDNQGNGWDMSAPFQVVPEPSSVVLAGFGVLALCAVSAGTARRR